MKYGVIGWPISHSKSPLLHNAAFTQLGLLGHYDAIAISPDDLSQKLSALITDGYRGLNVTVPHKEAILPLMTSLTPAAKAIGAVNTVIIGENKTCVGDNTDAPGFIADLRDHGIDPCVPAVVLGAGGAARAIIFGLLSAGCKELYLLNRDVNKAHKVASDMRIYFPDAVINILDNSLQSYQVASSHSLIINCTSLGLSKLDVLPWHPEVALSSRHIVYDLIYNPRETDLLQFAAQHQARAISGSGMLIHQAALAFSIWTGETPPIDIMQEAFENA